MSKRLTKSQYQLIAGVLKEYIEDRIESANDDEDREFRRQSQDDLELLKEIAGQMAYKLMFTDDRFKYKEFLKDCGIEVWERDDHIDPADLGLKTN